jgi:hypothetical protein
MKHWKKRYLLRFIAGMTGYAVLLPLSMIASKNIDASLTSKMLLVLIPIIPFILAISAVVANFKEMDELWRKILAESMLYTSLITAVTTFSLGLLQVNGFIPLVSFIYVLPYMCAIWGLSIFFVSKQYK